MQNIPTWFREPVLLSSGGFDFPVDPDLDACTAEVFWTFDAAPAVVTTVAEARFDRTAPGAKHRWQNVGPSVTVVSCTAPDGLPGGALVPFCDRWPVRLQAAQRARHALRGEPVPRLIPMYRARRIRNALRVFDARAERATYRTIGATLYGPARVDNEHWKTSALKAQVARLASYSRRLVASGYRQLLGGRDDKRR